MADGLHLPREVVDLICNLLSGNSLRACSTVNFIWSASSRALLFRAVKLVQVMPKRSSSVTVAHPLDIGWFHEFLSSTSGKALAIRVRELAIYGTTPGGVVRPPITAPGISRLLDKLPTCHTLHLQHLVVHCSPQMLTPNFTARSLNCLVLSDIGFHLECLHGDEEQSAAVAHPNVTCSLIEILNLFSTIQTLRISAVHKISDLDYYNHPRREELDMALAKAATAKLARGVKVGRIITTRTRDVNDLALDLLKGGCCELDFAHLEEHTEVCKRFFRSAGTQIRTICLLLPDLPRPAHLVS